MRTNHAVSRAVIAMTAVALMCAARPARSQEAGPERLPRRVTATGAKVEPLVVERRVTLYDTRQAARVQMQIVFSRSPAQKPAGAGGLLGGVDVDDEEGGEDPASAWQREAYGKLRAAGLAYYREATGDEAGEPTFTVRHNNASRGLDYAAELTARGYAEVDRADDGAGLWAALFGSEDRPEQAKLGEATERVTVTFDAKASEHGVVRLGATHQETVEPASPPRGADAQAWRSEVERRRKLLALKAEVLTRRLNLMPIRAPQEAAQAFERKQPYTVTRSVPLWGQERAVTIHLTGTASPVADGRLGEGEGGGRAEPIKLDASTWRQQVHGGWVMTITDDKHGRITGFFDLYPHERGYGGQAYMTAGVSGRWLGYVAKELEFKDAAVRGRFDSLSAEYPFTEFELRPGADGRTLTGRVWNQRTKGTITLVRAKPVIERVTVRRDRWSKSYAGLVKEWEEDGDFPVTFHVTLHGRELMLSTGYRFDDPALKVATTPSAYGRSPDVMALRYYERVELVLWGSKGLTPGPKKITIDGLTATVDLFGPEEADGDPGAEIREFGLREPQSEWGLGPLPTVDPQFRMFAEYDGDPSDAVKHANVWIERDHREVYRLPKEATAMRRQADRVEYGGQVQYYGTFFLPNAAVQSDHEDYEPPFTVNWPLNEGDVIVAELDGKRVRLRPDVLPVSEQLARPIIRFSIDAEGLKGLQEAHAPDGQWAQLMPVGQAFWVEARYYKQQTDAVKRLPIKWEGGQVEVELKLIKPAISLYRGGPFYVRPPAGGASSPGAPGAPGAPEGDDADDADAESDR